MMGASPPITALIPRDGMGDGVLCLRSRLSDASQPQSLRHWCGDLKMNSLCIQLKHRPKFDKLHYEEL